MGSLEALGTSGIPLVAAFFIGLLMTFTPCPLATNITAIAFISKKIGDSRHTLLVGTLYALGRMAAYIGLSALIVAKTAGATTIVIEPIAFRAEIARQFGADHVIDPSGSLKEEIMSLTEGRGGSVVVEASGNDKAIASIFDVAGHSARIRLIGHSVGRKVPIEIGLTLWKSLSITGSGGTRTFLPRTIDFMGRIRERVDFRRLITHRFPFKDLQAAFDKAIHDRDKALKVMLEI